MNISLDLTTVLADCPCGQDVEHACDSQDGETTLTCPQGHTTTYSEPETVPDDGAETAWEIARDQDVA